MAQPDTTLTKSRVKEILKLHGEISDLFVSALEKSIRVGELLITQKSELKHGEFGTWVETNLPFSQRAANQYMKFYSNRELLTNATNITEARALLTRPNSNDRANLDNPSGSHKSTSNVVTEPYYVPTAAENRRITKYVERDGLTLQQARRIIENDAKERAEKKAQKTTRKTSSKERLSVTITHRDKAALARLAKQQDTSIAEWFRSLLGKELSKQTKRTK